MLRRAISEVVALREPLVIGNVCEKLPGDFFATMDTEADEELAEALREMKLTPSDAPPEPKPETAVSLTAVEAEPVLRSTEPQEARISRQQAQHMMDLAAVKLDSARIAVQVTRQAAADARSVLAKAVMAWQEGGSPPLSREQMEERERRSFLNAESERRKARGKPHSQAAAYVQKRMSPNGGNSRGAYPRQYQNRTVTRPQ
jgi:hypothetical protein